MKNIIFSLLIILLGGCSNYIHTESINEITLKIDSININNKVSISSIENSINGIVLFDEYGRPDLEGSNTIIGAHSGNGANAYFNYLHTLNIGDIIELTYYDTLYKYEVKNVYDVDQFDLEPLKNKEYNILTLMTCMIGNSDRRIIVEATPVSNI